MTNGNRQKKDSGCDDEATSLLQSTTTTTSKVPSGTSTSSAKRGEEASVSRNVPRMFAYNFMDGASFSIWQSQVLQVLVYQLSGNTAVGWISGVAGVAQVFAAAAAGYSADILKRQMVCRTAAFCGLVGVITSLYAVYSLQTSLFFMAGIIWGTYMGLANPSSEALFADSITSGRRAHIYNLKW
eukprot:CAMPEP_0176438990 /NCGR_PEP_ID=MMETSP0127-20121128/19650_1 /TAXON_ID=938130 /ORGANISM="Platyophrya macrostoma, Strain WH" /LENGTH=183 /DNA_ID=CAMNT_0017823121 /DNA_START=45 /DNA_END=593 /DNA_ORIENTATION=-